VLRIFSRRSLLLLTVAPLLLPGCSTHPLPQDIIDLPVYEIVQRIQCEGARAVTDELSFRRGVRDNEEVKRIKKELEDNRKKIKAVDGQFDEQKREARRLHREVLTIKKRIKYPWTPSDFAQGDYESREYQFTGLSGAVYQLLEVAIEAAIAESSGEAEPGTEIRELNLISAKLQALWANVRALEKEKADLESESRNFAGVIGFRDTTAVFEFVFTVTENNNLTSTGTVTWPITIGVITLGYDVGDKKTRESDRKIRLVSTFGELVDFAETCGWLPTLEARIPRMYPIVGKIGLQEVIQDYMQVSDLKSGKFHPGNTADSYTDKIIFTTTVNAGLNPGIKLDKRMGQLIEASVDFDVDRKDVHQLAVRLTPAKPGTPKAVQDIIIRDMPSVRLFRPFDSDRNNVCNGPQVNCPKSKKSET
jgi:hypothetical protein